MPLPLHIFEPRYRELVEVCLKTDRRFGVLLFRPALERTGRIEHYSIGTIAEIASAARLEDGRLNIVTMGFERFHISKVFEDRSYLHALVQILDEPIGLPENVLPLAADAYALTVRYVELLLKLDDQEGIAFELPTEPLELSYKIAALLQTAVEEKQLLLEAENVEVRLRAAIPYLQRELAILDRIFNLPPAEKERIFSLN